MKLIIISITVILLILPLYSPAHINHCHHAYCCKTYYPYYYFSLDGELDNACVDACLDLKHSLRQCTKSCYNY